MFETICHYLNFNAKEREGSKGAISVRNKDKCWNLFFRVDTNNGYSIFLAKKDLWERYKVYYFMCHFLVFLKRLVWEKKIFGGADVGDGVLLPQLRQQYS